MERNGLGREFVPPSHPIMTGNYSVQPSDSEASMPVQNFGNQGIPHGNMGPGVFQNGDFQNGEFQNGAFGNMPGQPHVEHVDLPPVHREREVMVPHTNLIENVIEIPHVQYIERIEQVPRLVSVKKTVPLPKLEVTERIIEIPKHVKEEKIVEVPQVHIMDKVVEVPHYIVQEKLIERPKIMIQERIIPIPRRQVVEKVVEIPEEEYNKILQERIDMASTPYAPAQMTDYQQYDDEPEEGTRQPLFDSNGRPLVDEHGCQLYRTEKPHTLAQPMGDHRRGDLRSTSPRNLRPVDEVVEIPHVQHVYRNVLQPVYRHVPKPVEVPLAHYRPIPVENIIDRNVPIPVELQVVQEFLCPRLIPKYSEVPVPIPVTRIIEKPVPADAMFNSAIMDAYMRGEAPEVTPCYQMCGGETEAIPKSKMSPIELTAAGISTQPSISQVRSASNGVGWNMEASRQFLLEPHNAAAENRPLV